MAGDYSMYDSGAPTAHSRRPAAKQSRPEHPDRPELPFVAWQRPLTPTDFEYASEHYVQIADASQQAKAALEGTRVFVQSDASILPAQFRDLRPNASSSSSARVKQQPRSYTHQNSGAGPLYPSDNAFQPYRSGLSCSTHLSNSAPDGLLSSKELHSKNHARLSRTIEHCDFDSDLFSGNRMRSGSLYSNDTAGRRTCEYSAPSTEPSPKSITRKPVGLTQARAFDRSFPALPVLSEAASGLIRSEVHGPYEDAAPAPACEQWRPQSWNIIRDLKECLSGREGLKRQLLKEHYRRPRP